MEFIKIKEEMNYSEKKYNVQREIEDLFVKSDFKCYEPSFFEEFETYNQFNHRIKQSSMVKVINKDGNILILRPDITTSIIKNIIPKWEFGTRLKLFYNSTVFKSDYNITQQKTIGVEYLGDNGLKTDQEVIELAIDVLKKYDKNFILELGTTRYLDSLLNDLRLSEEDIKKLKMCLFNKNQFELERLLETIDVDGRKKDVLKSILNLQGSYDEIERKASLLYMNEEMKDAIFALKSLKSINGFSNIHIDLSMIPSFDYYDGIIFSGFYPDIYTPILSGGRYDKLTKMYGKDIPAIGFSININELMRVYFKERT